MIANECRLRYYLSLNLHQKINFKAKNLIWDNFLCQSGEIMYYILNAPSYISLNY